MSERRLMVHERNAYDRFLLSLPSEVNLTAVVISRPYLDSNPALSSDPDPEPTPDSKLRIHLKL